MTNRSRSAPVRHRVQRAGALNTGGVLAAVAATAVATSGAPAQALDACISSALGTLKSGSASCSASGALSVTIAIGANTTATVGVPRMHAQAPHPSAAATSSSSTTAKANPTSRPRPVASGRPGRRPCGR